MEKGIQGDNEHRTWWPRQGHRELIPIDGRIVISSGPEISLDEINFS